MNDYFDWKPEGSQNYIRCTDYGMHALSQPSIIRPSERVNFETIEGRSGSLTVLQGEDIYDDIEFSIQCIIEDPYMTVGDTRVSRVDAICKWLKGSGKVAFPTRPGGYYEGYITNQIGFGKIVRGSDWMQFSVNFHCKPYFYLNYTPQIITINSGSSAIITNLGNIGSLPIIRAYGNSSNGGEINVASGGNAYVIAISSFTDASSIAIDSEAKVAYKGTPGSTADPMILMTSRVSKVWPIFGLPTATITFDGSIMKLEVTPRWRCIG